MFLTPHTGLKRLSNWIWCFFFHWSNFVLLYHHLFSMEKLISSLPWGGEGVECKGGHQTLISIDGPDPDPFGGSVLTWSFVQSWPSTTKCQCQPFVWKIDSNLTLGEGWDWDINTFSIVYAHLWWNNFFYMETGEQETGQGWWYYRGCWPPPPSPCPN